MQSSIFCGGNIVNPPNIRNIFYSFIKIVSICAALFMIPVIFAISLSFPLFLLILFLLPLEIFVLWIIRTLSCRRLRRKETPVSYYIVVIASAIFLIVALGILTSAYLNKLSPEGMLRDINQIEFRKPPALIC